MNAGFGAFAVSWLLLACNDEDGLSLGRSEQPIVYGEPSSAVDDAVVRVRSSGGTCTATLLAPNLVVTARHCIAVVDRVEDFACYSDGTPVGQSGLITRDLEPEEVTIETGPGSCTESPVSGKAFYSTGSQTVCRNDLAYVLLDQPVRNRPVLPIRLTRPTQTGESVTVVGFGETETTGALGLRRRREGLSVLRVGANRFRPVGDQAVPGTFVVGQGPCSGDSGGPALSEASGALIGVYSIKSSPDCVDEASNGVYVLLAEYYDLTLKAFAFAGAEPWLEGEPAPAPEAAREDAGCSLGAGHRPILPASSMSFFLAACAAMRRQRFRRVSRLQRSPPIS